MANPAPQSAPESLSESLRSPEPALRAAALAERVVAGNSEDGDLPAIETALLDESPDVRLAALALLRNYGARGVPALAKAAAKDQPAPVRAMACTLLAACGEAAAPAERELCRCLSSDDPALRQASMVALSKIGAPVVPVLCKMLQFPQDDVVAAAAHALGLIGTAASKAEHDLKRAAARPHPKLRLTCAEAMVKITGDEGAGLRILTQPLTDPEAASRKAALEAIGKLGRKAQSCGPQVEAVLNDDSPEVRAEGALTLARIRAEPGRSVAALTRLLNDPDATVRVHGCVALTSFGNAATQAGEALRRLESDPEDKVRAAATAAIHRILG